MGETFPGFAFVGWFAMLAPTGTPAANVGQMNRELGKVLRDPEITARLREFGVYTEGGDTPENKCHPAVILFPGWEITLESAA